MNYLVMECHNSYAILLDDEGRFVKAANMHYEVGQTISNPVLMRDVQQPINRLGMTKQLRNTLTSITAAACMLLLCTGVYQTYMMPYTSLVLSINPSVQMELNRKGNVVDLTGLNEDGIHLLEGYKMSDKNRLTVTEELIDRAINLGYLHAGGQIVIQIDTPDDALFEQYGVELRTSVSTSLSEHTETNGTVSLQIEQTEKPKHNLEDLYDDDDDLEDLYDDDDDLEDLYDDDDDLEDLYDDDDD